MSVSALLCPVFIPPHLFFVGGLFTMVSVALPLVALYQIWWVWRYHRGAMLAQGTRLRGTIVGPGLPDALIYGRGSHGELVARTFELELGDDVARICPAGALLRGWPRRLRVGSSVTVDGFFGNLEPSTERLYREAAVEQGMRAVQITRGTWKPRVRLLRGLVLTWLACVGLFLFIAFAH